MNINPKYIPKSLTPKEKKAQVKSIKEKRDRPNQEKKNKTLITCYCLSKKIWYNHYG